MKKYVCALALVLAIPAAAMAGPRDGLGGGKFGGGGGSFGGGGGGNREAMHQKMQERMKEADTNGDGAVSKAEFLAKAEERFSKMDKDGDGQLTPKDREAMQGKMQKLKDKRDGGGKGDGETFP